MGCPSEGGFTVASSRFRRFTESKKDFLLDLLFYLKLKAGKKYNI